MCCTLFERCIQQATLIFDFERYYLGRDFFMRDKIIAEGGG